MFHSHRLKFLCAKIGYMYYCEYAHLLKKHAEHTCNLVLDVLTKKFDIQVDEDIVT